MTSTRGFSLAWSALALASGCAVDGYPVQVDSIEVREGLMAIQLDDSGTDPVLRLWFGFGVEAAGSCARLDDDAHVVMLHDGERVELEVTSRGDGFETLDCAVKCHQLVALGTRCAPLQAELRGDAVERIFAADQLRVAFDDDRASLGMTMAGVDLQRRVPTFPDGSVATVDSDTSRYMFTSVPYHWSHLDRAHWVNQWADNFLGSRDGAFSAFNFDHSIDSTSAPQALALLVRNDAPRGDRQVFFGAKIDAAECDFKRCDGLEYSTSATVTVVDRD